MNSNTHGGKLKHMRETAAAIHIYREETVDSLFNMFYG